MNCLFGEGRCSHALYLFRTPCCIDRSIFISVTHLVFVHVEPDVSMTWSFWAPEHPGSWFHSYKDCVLMKKDHGQWKWHEAMCHTFPFEYKFICEYGEYSMQISYILFWAK